MDSCFIASLKFILLCVSLISLPQAFVVMQLPPKVMDESLVIIWA